MSLGWLRTTIAKTGAKISEIPATSRRHGRHPENVATRANSGRNNSDPLAPAAENIPKTKPRCVSNQRVTTIAPTLPKPRPIPKPHNGTSCHTAEALADSAQDTPLRKRIAGTVRRTPHF
jgi:hypothetical protein